MMSPPIASLLCVVLLVLGLVHSTPSLFGAGNIYVGFTLHTDYLGSATLYNLNLGYSLHVSYLDWGSLSDEIIQTVVNQTTGDAILFGKAIHIRHSNNYFFDVHKVFVALPHSRAQIFDEYFVPNDQLAISANTGKSVSINSVTLELVGPFVDQSWIQHRIDTHDAVVQGHVTPLKTTSGTSSNNTLIADKVFISLPDQTKACKPLDPVYCPEDEVATYHLTPNRCLAPTTPPCVHPGVCALFIPECPPHYFLFSYPSKPFACPSFHCFPEFVNLQ